MELVSISPGHFHIGMTYHLVNKETGAVKCSIYKGEGDDAEESRFANKHNTLCIEWLDNTSYYFYLIVEVK